MARGCALDGCHTPSLANRKKGVSLNQFLQFGWVGGV